MRQERGALDLSGKHQHLARVLQEGKPCYRPATEVLFQPVQKCFQAVRVLLAALPWISLESIVHPPKKKACFAYG